MKRVVVEELLDSDAGTPAEVAGSIKDLRMFNSLFGGVHTMASLLRRVAQKRGLKQISWVDVAGGEGYVATRTQKSLARSGISFAAGHSGPRSYTPWQYSSCRLRGRSGASLPRQQL